MADRIETIHGSLIQHGPHNGRIYLMKLEPAKADRLVPHLDKLARNRGYGKILAKVPATALAPFQAAGYCREAVIPRFFRGAIDGHFMAKYIMADRRLAAHGTETPPFVPPGGAPRVHARKRVSPPTPAIEECRPADMAEVGRIFSEIFQSYPFPIHNSAYLRQALQSGVRYYCIRHRERIAAVAATEVDLENRNAELTDFATLPQYRGTGLAHRLITHMEREVCGSGTQTAYTIARAASPGMNMVFSKNGYAYAGFLPNNTQICGRIESMVVWYKHI